MRRKGARQSVRCSKRGWPWLTLGRSRSKNKQPPRRLDLYGRFFSNRVICRSEFVDSEVHPCESLAQGKTDRRAGRISSSLNFLYSSSLSKYGHPRLRSNDKASSQVSQGWLPRDPRLL